MSILKTAALAVLLATLSAMTASAADAFYGIQHYKLCFQRDWCYETQFASLVWVTYANGERGVEVFDLTEEGVGYAGAHYRVAIDASYANQALAITKRGPIVRAEVCPPSAARIPIKEYRCTILYQEPLAVWQRSHP